jgi:hypothetical protein
VDQGEQHFTSSTSTNDQLTSSKGLLAVPFVLHSQPTAVFEPNGQSVEQQANVAQQRYAEIFRDVENIINDHSESHMYAGHREMASLTASTQSNTKRLANLTDRSSSFLSRQSPISSRPWRFTMHSSGRTAVAVLAFDALCRPPLTMFVSY